MQPDEEGFVYPVIEENSCVNCHQCEKVCPTENVCNRTDEVTEAYEFQIMDDNDLKNSASGGFFTSISKYIVEHNGYVCGAIFDQDNQVVHRVYSSIEDCKKFRGSKYVQSDINQCFSVVKDLLDQGKLVCFSGTPCQVEGLNSFLRKAYTNLILIDVLCAGVPSPKLWNAYLEWQESRNDAKVNKVNFRNKTYGYQCSTMKLDFDNGTTYSQSGRIDPMMKFFVSGIAKRPICYQCPFKGVDRVSDFTIFDGWSADRLLGIKDNDKGYTAVLVHSRKAKNILAELNDSYILQVDRNLAVEMDGIMALRKPYKHPNRDRFYSYLTDNGIENTIIKFLPNSIMDRVLEKIKPILYKLGIIKLVKK
jgi:hypothetical protein